MTRSAAITIETPSARQQAEFLEAANRSVRLHHPWVDPPRTEAQYDDFLRRARRRTNAAHFVRTPDGELAGAIVMSEIVRGGFQSAYIGYYAFEPHAGHGFMRRGLDQVIRLAFGEYRLHRLEANIQPENARSIQLVRGLGFRHEGFSPRYLRIAGRWCDHERWALTVEDWKARTTKATKSRIRSRT